MAVLTQTHWDTCLYGHTHTHTLHACTRTHTYALSHTHTHTHTHTHKHTHMHFHTHKHTHMHTHTGTQTHTYALSHTNTHTHRLVALTLIWISSRKVREWTNSSVVVGTASSLNWASCSSAMRRSTSLRANTGSSALITWHTQQHELHKCCHS